MITDEQAKELLILCHDLETMHAGYGGRERAAQVRAAVDGALKYRFLAENAPKDPYTLIGTGDCWVVRVYGDTFDDGVNRAMRSDRCVTRTVR